MMLGACAPIGTDEVPGASTPPPPPPSPAATPTPDVIGVKKYIPLIVAAVVLYYIIHSKK